MKRSEMVSLIWDAINELEDGDHILKRIEAAGMLPPSRDAIVITYVNEIGTTTVERRNFWDPEEEKRPADEDHTTYEEWRKSHGAK